MWSYLYISDFHLMTLSLCHWTRSPIWVADIEEWAGPITHPAPPPPPPPSPLQHGKFFKLLKKSNPKHKLLYQVCQMAMNVPFARTCQMWNQMWNPLIWTKCIESLKKAHQEKCPSSESHQENCPSAKVMENCPSIFQNFFTTYNLTIIYKNLM